MVLYLYYLDFELNFRIEDVLEKYINLPDQERDKYVSYITYIYFVLIYLVYIHICNNFEVYLYIFSAIVFPDQSKRQ